MFISWLTFLFESLGGDPGFVGADCPCMCSLYADCENYGASASAPVEKAPGMCIWPQVEPYFYLSLLLSYC